jgi:hypothetical protein
MKITFYFETLYCTGMYNMRVLGRAQVPSQYRSTSDECTCQVLVLLLALKLKEHY